MDSTTWLGEKLYVIPFPWKGLLYVQKVVVAAHQWVVFLPR